MIGACIVSAATATEVGAKGVRREPWANAPFTPGALGDYMDAQFEFFNSKQIYLMNFVFQFVLIFLEKAKREDLFIKDFLLEKKTVINVLLPLQ